MRNRRRHLFSAAIFPVLATMGVRYRTEAEGAEPSPAGTVSATDTFGKLRQEFSKHQKDAADLISLAVSETRDLTEEETKANDNRFSRMQQIKRLLDDDIKFAKLALGDNPRAGRTSDAGT